MSYRLLRLIAALAVTSALGGAATAAAQSAAEHPPTPPPPTGKRFAIGMATIGHWKKDGTMDHEWLFWNNQDFMKQIGLGQ